MNDQNVVCTHELTIRFEQFEDGSLQYSILPDQGVSDTHPASLITLAEHGAPLSLMGIRALWKFCADGLVVNSLDLASMIKKEVEIRVRPPLDEAELIEAPEGVTLN
jgi:hypothetical protein